MVNSSSADMVCFEDTMVCWPTKLVDRVPLRTEEVSDYAYGLTFKHHQHRPIFDTDLFEQRSEVERILCHSYYSGTSSHSKFGTIEGCRSVHWLSKNFHLADATQEIFTDFVEFSFSDT